MGYTTEGRRYATGTITGTRVAADFTIDLGFTPRLIRVVNLTDRIEAEHVVDKTLDGGANARSTLTLATGDKTYVPAGISTKARSFTVDVSIVGLETDNDDVFWEAFD